MTQKEFASRIVHKHDIETNWNKATTFIPKQGEMIVYDIDDLHDYERIKIGDGVTAVTDLPFYQENVAYINASDNETITDVETSSSGISIDVTAQVGQTIVVKEVDANGKPTAWESADCVQTTAQNFTEEQKAQARKNIGIVIEEDDENSSTAGINYTYDGNNESDAHTWVTIANGARQLVKVADIPDGEIDLIGCEVSVLLPKWPYHNYSFTITSEMFNEVSGLTQILYQNTAINDKSPITMIAICTTAGRYSVALNGWNETLYFPETGIYFMDGRGNGDEKYVASLFRSGASGSDENEEIEENPAEYDGNEIQVFNRGICVGDSITHGTVDHSEGQINVKHYSYPTILSKMTGVNIVNAGVPGFTAKDWYDASIDGKSIGGTWLNNEWVWSLTPNAGENDVVSKSLDYSGFDFAVIHLGINDVLTVGYGATLETALAEFETSINNIITKLKDSNTGIKIFLATIIPCYAYDGSVEYATFNEKIREIANSTSDVYLIDLNKYSEIVCGTPYENQHLTAVGYHKMANEIMSLINYTIHNNLADFKWVQFIGTDHTI